MEIRRDTSHSPARAWLRRAAMLTSASIVGIAFVGFVVDRHLNGNLRTLDVTRALGIDALGAAPADGSDAMNLLVLGSDTRSGQGSGYGPDDHAGLSDTAMLVHLAAGRHGATVVSIPRDLLVARPSCLLGDGNWSSPATGVQFNTALAIGGPACSIRTTEELTGLRVDHFMEIDFDGFVAMTEAVGGVEVCLPHAVHDADSGLDLPAGPQLVTGRQALAFVRDRHSVGDGSDLARIQMQHEFLASLLQKAMSTNVLATPTTLYRLADAATRSVTTDPGLGSLQSLVGLAASLRNLALDRVAFMTYPYVKDPANLNRLLPDQQLDAELATRLGDDEPVTAPAAAGVPARGAAAPEAGAGVGAASEARAAAGQVELLNATGVPGLAARVAAALRADGFAIAGVGSAPRHGTRGTVITYAPAQAASARSVERALAAMPGGGTTRLAATARDGAITVVLGAPYAPITRSAAQAADTAQAPGAGTGAVAAGAAAALGGGAAPTAADDTLRPDRVASQSTCSSALTSP